MQKQRKSHIPRPLEEQQDFLDRLMKSLNFHPGTITHNIMSDQNPCFLHIVPMQRRANAHGIVETIAEKKTPFPGKYLPIAFSEVEMSPGNNIYNLILLISPNNTHALAGTTKHERSP